jgi:phage shock protein C
MTEPEMTEPEPTPSPTRGRLYRSRTDRMIGGVAGGLAEYLNIDPVLTRLGFVLFAFAGGAGVLIYVIAWIIIPEQPLPDEVGAVVYRAAEPSPSEPRAHHVVRDARIVVGSMLILLGSIFLADKIFPGINFHGYFWPILLIALGGGLILYGTRR